MNLSELFKRPRVMEGHGLLMTRYPSPPFSVILLPESSKISATKPGMGHPTVQGLSAMTGSTLTIAPPISVPPDKLIIGQRFLPTLSKYHVHASLFIGSPVVAKILSEEKL